MTPLVPKPTRLALGTLALVAAGPALLGLLGPASAFAQQSARLEPVSEQAFLEELPVLSVSRLPQSPAEVPGAVTVFDRDFIRATGYREIGQLLRLVPGMGVVNDRGHSPWIAYHGLGSDYSNRMQVLIDGRSVYSPSQIGGADWSGLPITLEEIERIEVLRGSNAAAYGSNAFLGVVNIITRHAAQDPGVALGASVGNRGLLDGSGRVGVQSGPFAARLNWSHIDDEGFRKLTDDRRSKILTLRADYQMNPRDALTFWAGANDGTRINGFPNTPNNTNGLRDLTSYNRFAHLRFRRAFDAGNEISVGYYRNDESITEGFNATFPPFFPVVPVDINRQSTRDNVDFQHTLTLGPSLRMVWGAEGRRDWVQAPSSFYAYGDASSRLWRTFANAEWRAMPSLVINAGAMVERYNGGDPRLSPRLFANWTPLAGQTLRAGYSDSYRELSLFEQRADQRFYSGPILLSYAVTSPGNLRPERVRTGEIGWVGHWGANATVTSDLRIFNERLTDLVDRVGGPTPAGFAPVTPGTDRYINIGVPIDVRGAELQLRARPWRGGEFLLASAYVRIVGYKPEAERTAPRHQSNLTWLQRLGGGWSATATYFYVGQRAWFGSVVTPSYHYADVRLAYNFRLSGRNVEWALAGQNLGRNRTEFRLNAPYQPINPIAPLVFTSVRVEL